MEENEPQRAVGALERVVITVIEQGSMTVRTLIWAIRPPPPPNPDVVLTRSFFDFVQGTVKTFMEIRERQRLREERERGEGREVVERDEPSSPIDRPIKRAELISRSVEGLDGRRILHQCGHDEDDTIIEPEHVTVVFRLPDGVDPTTVRVGVSENGLLVCASGDRLKGWYGRPYEDGGEPTPFSVRAVIANHVIASRDRGEVEYAIRREEFSFDRIIATYHAPRLSILIPRIKPIDVFAPAVIAPAP